MAKISHIHGGNLFRIAREAGTEPDKLIDFSANINPLGPGEDLLQVLAEGLRWIGNYPDSQCFEAKQALAAHVGVSEEYLTLGNGAIELIYLLMQHFQPAKVLLCQPTFSEYESAVAISGGSTTYYPLLPANGFRLDLDGWLQAFASCQWAILCNPNNPTGVLLDRDMLTEIARYAKAQDKFVLVDEAFIDFTWGGRANSVVNLVEQHPNLLVSYSLTKILAIPGLRLGALIASPEITQALHQVKDPWNVNSLAQLACSYGLRQKEFFAETRRWLLEEQRYMLQELATITKVKVYPPAANFILLEVETEELGVRLQQYLLGQGIMVRDCGSFPGLKQSFIRIAIKNRHDNEQLLMQLKAFLGSR